MLTIHSSRRRFAARLNSSVRPLGAMLPQLRPGARRRNSPTGSCVGFLALCSNLVQRLVLASTSPGARGLSRQQTRKHSRPPQLFLAALSLCARATRLSDGAQATACNRLPCARAPACPGLLLLCALTWQSTRTSYRPACAGLLSAGHFYVSLRKRDNRILRFACSRVG